MWTIMALYANWIVRGRLLASSQPQSLDDLFEARKMGVSVVLSFDSHPEEREWCRKLGLRFKEVALSDFEPPSVEKIGEAVGFLYRYIFVQKRSVIMHCYAGLGRTGTVSACFIGALLGLAADDAIKVVRAIRPGSIEANQEVAVEEFLESFRRGEVNRELAGFCSRCEKQIMKPVKLCAACLNVKSQSELIKLIQSFGLGAALKVCTDC